MSDSWRTRVPCTRAEADAVQGCVNIGDDVVLVAHEPDENVPDAWVLDAYTAEEPDSALLARLGELAGGGAAPLVERIEADDWVTMSQAGLEPVTVGRYHVHTPEHRGSRRPGRVNIEVPAGLAFGTGQHATTAGCLALIGRLARRGTRVRNALDLGTGTAVLAIAIARTWRRARVTGSDIDPVSVAVARENSGRNQAHSIRYVAAPGLEHPLLLARAPYDLVAANILAGPLFALAPGVVAATKRGGIIILAGLVARQERRVRAAYAGRGCVLVARAGTAEWPVLAFRRRRAGGSRRGTAGGRPTQSAW